VKKLAGGRSGQLPVASWQEEGMRREARRHEEEVGGWQSPVGRN